MTFIENGSVVLILLTSDIPYIIYIYIKFPNIKLIKMNIAFK